MTESQKVLQRELNKLMFQKRKASQRNDVHGDYYKNSIPRKE